MEEYLAMLVMVPPNHSNHAQGQLTSSMVFPPKRPCIYMRGAGAPVFESDLPPGSDQMKTMSH